MLRLGDVGKRAVPVAVREAAKPLVRAASCATSGLRSPPDFYIIGTKRGGTTSLWNWLLEHPAMLPLVPATQNLKSTHYFSMNYGLSESWFRSFFPLTSTRRLVQRRLGIKPVSGEASPYYLMDSRIPSRVMSASPDARIIVLLRDPVERAYSHHRERVHEGVENLSFSDALDAEAGRVGGELVRMTADPMYYSQNHDWYTYRSRGLYAPQVHAWRAVVDPQHLLVVRSEDLYKNPQKAFDVVTGFLGLPGHELRRAERYNYHPAAPMPAEVRSELTRYYRAPNEELYALLGRDFGWCR